MARLGGLVQGCQALISVMYFRAVRHLEVLLVLAVAVLVLEIGDRQASAQARAEQTVGATGLPLPRFVSLRASEINLRIGPGTRFPIDWVYRRPGLPVEIINEHATWRQIRDHENTVGWVHMSMLSSRRGVLVLGPMGTLRHDPDEASQALAYLQPGVVGQLERCDRGWCRVEVAGLSGWLSRNAFFGLYDDEVVQ